MDKALHKLKSIDKSRPFAMMIHNKAPHRSWMPDSAHLEKFDNRRFPLPETFFDDYQTRSEAARKQDMRIMDLSLPYDLMMNPDYFSKKAGDSNIRRRYLNTHTAGGGPYFNPIKGFKSEYRRLNATQKKGWDAHYDSVAQAFAHENPTGKALAYWKYEHFMKDYLRVIASVDDNVGRLLDYLDQAGLTKNTIVVYTSDQGFFLGEHGWFDKRFMYEPSVKTPLVIRYPKQIKAGSVSHKLVSNLDFAPTFVDEAGANVPDAMQGKSLEPILKGHASKWRNSFYYHYYEYHPNRGHRAMKHYGIKTERYKLIHFYHSIDAWELYDLKNDPEEVNNLYGITAYQPLADSLKNKLRQLQIQYRDTSFKDRLIDDE